LEFSALIGFNMRLEANIARNGTYTAIGSRGALRLGETATGVTGHSKLKDCSKRTNSPNSCHSVPKGRAAKVQAFQ
jgi:hypothetical protein